MKLNSIKENVDRELFQFTTFPFFVALRSGKYWKILENKIVTTHVSSNSKPVKERKPTLQLISMEKIGIHQPVPQLPI